MGALVGLGVGRRAAARLVGVLRAPRDPGDVVASRARLRGCSRGPGWAGVGRRAFVAAVPGQRRCWRRWSSRSSRARRRWRWRSARWAAYLPVAVVAGRARRRQREFAEVWPEAVDNLASAVRAGMSLPDALAGAGRARAGAAAAGVRRVRARLPGDAAGSARASTGSRTGWPTRSATASSRGCGSPARSAAASWAGCCATCPATCATTRAPAPSSRRGRPGRSTARGSRWPRRGWCCC